MKQRTITPFVGTLAVAASIAAGGFAHAAGAQEAKQKARQAELETKQEAREAKQDTKAAARKTGNAMSDSWVTMKVHSQFVPEDALEDSDIDVTTRAGVVTLTGTVPTAAGKSRAVAIAKATDGVKSVSDRLRIARMADDDDDDDDDRVAPKAGAATREAGRDGTAATREAARDTKAGARTAGRAVSDGWLTSKIYADFIDEAPLEDSDIDVDVTRGVVVLNGTVRSQAGAARALAVAQKIEGVKSVKSNLKVGAPR